MAWYPTEDQREPSALRFADSQASLRHKRSALPIHFPAEALVPETKQHLKLRTLLFTVLETLADQASIGSEQFIYWNPIDPSRCLAPDVFVRLGAPDSSFDTWKTWERGAPELAVEIVSESDAPERVVEEKVHRYHELGVRELVRFDPNAPEGARLRVWDRLDGDLVERVVERDRTPCTTLNLQWVVVPGAGYPAALRLARDERGKDLVLTRDEARIRELEEELRRRR